MAFEPRNAPITPWFNFWNSISDRIQAKFSRFRAQVEGTRAIQPDSGYAPNDENSQVIMDRELVLQSGPISGR